MATQRILVVDDDPLSRDFLSEAVQALGHTAIVATDGDDALLRVAAEQPDIVLTDLRMPGMDGITLVKALHERAPELPTVVITAHGTIQSAVDAMQHGARDFLMKPCTPETLELVFNRIARTSQLERENDYLRSEVAGTRVMPLIAHSNAMIELLRSAARISRSRGTVLITGESGTGKERIAQYIHQNSSRTEAPFVRVNCAALSEQLLESELFGHERGAFTGAHRQRAGRFELADNGTLLLDELAEISPNMQAKLLRVLQEAEFERVGGQKTLKVDVRVIATTNRDLAKEVAEGRFREDLYYRLHVLPIHIAPLRDRKEDVLPLAEHFVEHFSTQNGVSPHGLTEEAQTCLLAWNWPGNVRELENVIQRAVILGGEEPLPADLMQYGPSSALARSAGGLSAANLTIEDAEFGRIVANNTVADIERITILATLESTRGNKSEAARRLGLTARTLSNKMKIWKQSGLVA
ncbi:MAG: DNA-binding NtrC family response regulator [Chlamydiales bacterium]|jgi:DNA-binding NtrC family response regulator